MGQSLSHPVMACGWGGMGMGVQLWVRVWVDAGGMCMVGWVCGGVVQNRNESKHR